MTLIYIIISTVLISLVSLVGIFFISINEKLLKRIIFYLVTFATGVLLGGALLHLLPEAFESNNMASFWVLLGIISFFMLEKFLFWRHCHNGVCDIHPFRYLNLIGDAVHNFIDGTIIAAAFIADVKLGIATSIIVIAHEIPQEIGDFGILIYGGLSKKKALCYNLISALCCVLGGVVAYFFISTVQGLTSVLIAFAGGNFLYIALVDLLPELRKTEAIKGSIAQLLVMCLGVFFMWLLTLFPLIG